MKVCSDTGPILHLSEIKEPNLLKIFNSILISPYIEEELLNFKIKDLPSNFEIKPVNKDQVSIIIKKYELDLGEASVIWLCKSENVSVLLTDDLSAREIAKVLGLEPVRTLGIILRAYREGLITQIHTIEILKSIQTKSTLFVTSYLIDYAINEVKKFSLK